MNKKYPVNVDAEVHQNNTDMRSHCIRKGDIDIIVSQTGIQDVRKIECVLMECNNDISAAIFNLLKGDSQKKDEVEKETTVFDEIRVILNEKDTLYHDMMTQKSK